MDWASELIGIAADNFTLKFAVFHTLFNLVGVVLMLPLIGVLVAFLQKLLREKVEPVETTRVLFLNTPGNPTGSIIPRRHLRELANYCRERQVWLVCDEVYSMFVYEGRHSSARASARSVSGLSR